MPWFSFLLRLVFWSQTGEMKNGTLSYLDGDGLDIYAVGQFSTKVELPAVVVVVVLKGAFQVIAREAESSLAASCVCFQRPLSGSSLPRM